MSEKELNLFDFFSSLFSLFKLLNRGCWFGLWCCFLRDDFLLSSHPSYFTCFDDFAYLRLFLRLGHDRWRLVWFLKFVFFTGNLIRVFLLLYVFHLLQLIYLRWHMFGQRLLRRWWFFCKIRYASQRRSEKAQSLRVLQNGFLALQTRE